MVRFCFYDWIIFHCMNIPQLLYPFTHWWTLRLCSCLGYLSIMQQWTWKYIYLYKLMFLFSLDKCNCPRNGIAVSQVALVVKNPATNSGDLRDTGSIPGSRSSLGGGWGNPLPYSCLENPMDRRAWRAILHGVAKSWTWLKQLATSRGSSIFNFLRKLRIFHSDCANSQSYQ